MGPSLLFDVCNVMLCGNKMIELCPFLITIEKGRLIVVGRHWSF